MIVIQSLLLQCDDENCMLSRKHAKLTVCQFVRKLELVSTNIIALFSSKKRGTVRSDRRDRLWVKTKNNVRSAQCYRALFFQKKTQVENQEEPISTVNGQSSACHGMCHAVSCKVKLSDLVCFPFHFHIIVSLFSKSKLFHTVVINFLHTPNFLVMTNDHTCLFVFCHFLIEERQ